MPENFFTTMSESVDPKESEEVLKSGYQCAMGMLLWASRRAYPMCKIGVHMLCRVMSKPTWTCFKAAMRMIRWLYDNRHKGIKIQHNQNIEPMGFVDASNKPDPKDGHCMYGFIITLLGAPVCDQCRKLDHVGLSSEHNEYMALAHANKVMVWFR